MKKVISILMAAIMTVSCFALAFNVSAAEAGTLPSNAISLTAGQFYTKYWTHDNYKLNCYNKITVPSRGYITLTLEKPYDDEGEICSYDLVLVDANGNNVWYGYTGAQVDSFSEYFVFRVGLKAGTYYLNVKANFYVYSDSAPIAAAYKYTFKADNYWEVEPNNTQATATAIAFDKMYSGVYTDEAYKSTYTDYYKVNLQKGVEYKLKVENYEELDSGTLILYLVDTTGEETSLYDYKMSGITAIFSIKPTKSGTYYIKFANDGNDGGIDYKVGVSAVKKSISKMTAKLSATSYVYDGNAKKPKVTISGLTNGTDFTVTYSNNVKVGTAKVVIKGKGAYEGTITKTFKINPKATKLSSVTAGAKKATVKWKKQASQTTGYQIQYSKSSSFTSAKTVTVKGASTVSTVIKNLTKGKTYYFRVRTYKYVNDTRYYSAWSSKMSTKIK